ncbi:tautomerase family protein [Actinoplanes teichomyceticus]|uniref:4-oxalocrotonate tautomerase n=1 Tax=Actinoplanes teichomyceticus TaxID=1867 RepID=A0A561WBM8_ACTTI|nr:tautomerase family protein [Actinoplanes teichomyceticus]TWG21268.1 4-oxalocrotonate tautomerase [Actinoplanes teichomyceticus]GIF16719.1 hypothetical protein Ate01nite_67510 [Actinoplanes teichomyceticus]
MPHVNIKFFPVPLAPEAEQRLLSRVTEAVTGALGCDPGVVSIALEPVDQPEWDARVYQPEIVERRHLLKKAPNY